MSAAVTWPPGAGPRVADAPPPTLGGLVASFVRRHWRPYAISALMLMGIAGLIVWVPRQIGHIVDALVAGRLGPQALALELAWLLGVGLVIYGLRVAWRLQLYAASYRLGVELRLQLYRRLSQHSAPFYQQRRTGELMALATNDVDAVELAAGEAVLAGFDGAMTFIVVVGMMAWGVDARLAALALLPFPLMALSFWWISRRVHRASGVAFGAFGRLNDHVQESLAGVRTLRAMGAVARSRARLAECAHDAALASRREQGYEAAFEPAVGISLATAAALVLAGGGVLVWRGELSLGQLTSFGIYLGQLVWPMFAAGWVLSLIERGRAAWGRLAPVLAEPPDVADEGTASALPPGPLVAHGLSLRYPGQAEPALQDVSFTLPPGGTLGIVGPTGAGKSSLLKLLMRQWPADAGTCHCAGVPLDAVPLSRLRSAFAWVPQEPMLFSMSLAENLALAIPQAPHEAVAAAVRTAALEDDIARLPQGLDTPVGERGVTLSGGQKQRVAIARGLLAPSRWLLLDDALSAVDTETESRILQRLREGRGDRSLVVVSHRLSAVAEADEILVLQHGRVSERGTHAALLATGGWYAQQWRLQQLQASLAAD